MPPAIVSANIGGVLAPMQQAQLQKADMLSQLSQLAQHQQPTESQYRLSALMNSQQNILAPMIMTDWTGRDPETIMDRCDELIARIAFWLQIPVIGKWIVETLVKRLERFADTLERMAAIKKTEAVR